MQRAGASGAFSARADVQAGSGVVIFYLPIPEVSNFAARACAQQGGEA
jgi:hypothetical protein